MRPEQREAVERTAAYFHAHAGADRPPKFLWNAKMRFGKTFAAYELAKEMGWTRVLVLTYKPAVQIAWRDDLLGHVDFSGWHFVDRDTPIEEADELLSGSAPVVRFASFQDLNGKSPDGQVKAHNESIHLTDWDCIILDEYHFGAWRDNARDLYDPTDKAARRGGGARRGGHRGGPWPRLGPLPLPVGYAVPGDHERRVHRGPDLQLDLRRRAGSEGGLGRRGGPNPYLELPGMEMYAYEIAPGAAGWAEDGEFSGFSLTEYFKAKRIGDGTAAPGPGDCVFEDPGRVSEFLEMLRGKLSEQMKVQVVAGQKPPFPYEHPKFTDQIKHSVWYMPDVASCFAMRDMLDEHPYFSGYEIVVAAGSRRGRAPTRSRRSRPRSARRRRRTARARSRSPAAS